MKLLKRYWATELFEYHEQMHQRFLIYLVYSVAFGIWIFSGLTTSPIAKLVSFPQTFRAMYSIETAFNFGLCFSIIDLGISVVHNRFSRFERTCGKLWLVGLISFFCAFGIQRTFLYWRIDNYYPQLIEQYNYLNIRPTVIATFYFFSKGWLMVFVSITFIVIMLQRSNIETNKKLNDQLQAKNRAYRPIIDSKPNKSMVCDIPIANSALSKDIVQFPKEIKASTVTTKDISHVTIEDHYCRVFITTNEKQLEILIKISLTKLLNSLPAHQFIQIHRSHIVNLSYIRTIEKSGRSFKVTLKNSHRSLPLSRRRLNELKPFLKDHFFC